MNIEEPMFAGNAFLKWYCNVQALKTEEDALAYKKKHLWVVCASQENLWQDFVPLHF